MDVDRVPLQRADRWLEEAGMVLREPALGLLALEQLERGAGHAVELAAECAATLRDALLVLARHISLLNDAASFHLYLQRERAILVLGWRLSLSHTTRDFLAGSLALLVSRWLGSSAELELWFAGARPSYALTYCRVLRDISLGFYAPYDALVLPSATLATTMPLANPKLHDVLLRVISKY